MIYNKPEFEYNSIFASHIRDYIELRESLGAKFRAQSGILRQFDRYCSQNNIQSEILSEELVSDWLFLRSNEKSSSHASRISTIKVFSEYLVSVGYPVTWHSRPGYTKSNFRYVPYIYSKDEMRRILEIAENLPKPRGDSMFHLVFPAVIKLLYCCGLRVSEALELRTKDVDLENGFINIEKAKFENCRRLPLSSSLVKDLKEYSVANQKLIGIDNNGFFFPNAKGEKYSQRTVYDMFRTVLWQSGIPHMGKGKGPRVHDMRHTFAVHSLQQNISAGKDIYVSLPILMTYLGHSKVSSTEYYLRLTAEIFPDFLEKADTVCATAIPEVTAYEN